MGDMADWINEQGQHAFDAHNLGDCDGDCPYCEEEQDKLRRKLRDKWKKKKGKSK